MGQKAVKKAVTKTTPKADTKLATANSKVKFDYHTITVKVNVKTADGFKEEEFQTRSTYGKEGDVVTVDDPFTTHPAWTGDLKNSVARAGKLADFRAKFGIDSVFDDVEEVKVKVENTDKKDN